MAVRIFSLGGLHALDARWLTFGFEREINVVPRQTALGLVVHSNVIGPTCGKHEKYFIALGFRQFIELWHPASFVPGIFL